MDIGKAGFASSQLKTLSLKQSTNQATKATDRVLANSKSKNAAAPEKTVLDEIRDKGFTAYSKEINDKKLEDLRAKILGSMGLTEEEFAKLPFDQQQIISKMVDLQMQKYTTAEAALSQNNKEALNLHDVKPMANVKSNTTQIDSAGVGIGPLLALQEVEQAAEQEGKYRA